MIINISHTLRGLPGWSSLQLSIINVTKIHRISYHKRLFRIFNRNLPYSLTIVYNEPTELATYIPMFTGIGFNYMPIFDIDKTQIITKRYASARDCIDEIDEIKLKQQIQIYTAKLARENGK